MYFSFTYPKYMKLYCSNIFLQNADHGLEGAPSSCVPERGVPRRGEQSSVVIISYKGYSPPKCTCNGCTENTFKQDAYMNVNA